MNGADVRAFRQRWGLTQRQLAEYLSLSPGEGSVSHQMVCQMENGARPIPRRSRSMAEHEEPSIFEALGELLALPDVDVPVALRGMCSPSPRGPYSKPAQD